MDRLDAKRRAYAVEIQTLAGIRSSDLVEAFATVPRERFLGPGPWRTLRADRLGDGYATTPSADPCEIYENVLVAIDEARGLNNGEPRSAAGWLDQLDLRRGERVLHVGAGVGYYTAIIAAVVGETGSVDAAEIDPGLAARARENLRGLAHVRLSAGDGTTLACGPVDAVFVSAGATRPPAAWLDALAPAGRLLMPLTVSVPGRRSGVGRMLEVVRVGEGYAAWFVSFVGIYHLAGGRGEAEERALHDALERGGEQEVRSLRRDAHAREATCWLHAQDHCLSTLPRPMPPGRQYLTSIDA